MIKTHLDDLTQALQDCRQNTRDFDERLEELQVRWKDSAGQRFQQTVAVDSVDATTAFVNLAEQQHSFAETFTAHAEAIEQNNDKLQQHESEVVNLAEQFEPLVRQFEELLSMIKTSQDCASNNISAAKQKLANIKSL